MIMTTHFILMVTIFWLPFWKVNQINNGNTLYHLRHLKFSEPKSRKFFPLKNYQKGGVSENVVVA